MNKFINYDELNKYDFTTKYYLKIAIYGDISDVVEVSKDEYLRIKNKTETEENTTVTAFKRYFVGFYKDEITYITKEVNKDVFYCLKKSQTYESNKVRHEKERHLDTYFLQDDIEKIPALDNTEDKALKIVENLELQILLDKLLSEKQSRRVYRNKIEEIPLITIAKEEGVDVAAIKRSVDRAILKLLENYKKY